MNVRHSAGKNSMSISKDPKKVRASFYLFIYRPRQQAIHADVDSRSTVFRWSLEDPRRVTRSIPLQESQYWLCQSHFSSQYRWTVSHFLALPSLAESGEYVWFWLSILALRSGSVCLDVINQTWSPMYDMINIFEVFLPQLLRYPNPSDPLNGEAAAMLMRDPKNYESKVRGSFRPYSSDSRPFLDLLLMELPFCETI